MKHSFDADFTVQVREEVREQEPEFAQFYQGIYSMALNTFVDVMFIPHFSRERENWSLKIPNNIDIVHSVQEARLFTAALADYIVMPDESCAGQEELIPQLPSPQPYFDTPLDTGVIFYVTPQEFSLFSQELAEIEQQAFALYDNLRVSKLGHFECIKFINKIVMTSEHFLPESLTMLGRHKQMLNPFPAPYAHVVNGTPIYSKQMLRNGNGRGEESKQLVLALGIE